MRIWGWVAPVFTNLPHLLVSAGGEHLRLGEGGTIGDHMRSTTLAIVLNIMIIVMRIIMRIITLSKVLGRKGRSKHFVRR